MTTYEVLGYESWAELYESMGDNEIVRAMLREGLLDETDLRERMIKEQVAKTAHGKKKETIARLAERFGMSRKSVHYLAYRKH